MKLENGNFIWIIENGSRFECPIAINDQTGLYQKVQDKS